MAQSQSTKPSWPAAYRLLRLGRPVFPLIAAGTVALVVGSAMALVYPQGVRMMMDRAVSSHAEGFLRRAAIIMVAVAAVQAVGVALRQIFFNMAGERVVTRLRKDVFGHIARQEVAFFDKRRTGELMSRLAGDTTVLQSAVSGNIAGGLRHVAVVVGGVGFLVYTSPMLTGIMLLVVPPIAVGAVFYGRRVRKLARELQDAHAASNEVAEECFSGIRTVRAFAAEWWEQSRYGEALDKAMVIAARQARAGAAFNAGMCVATYSAASLVFWYGGRLLTRGEITIGGLTSFVIYTLMVAFSLAALADLWVSMMRSLGAADRVFELLDRVPAMPLEGGVTLRSSKAAVRLEGVRFSYPSRPDAEILKGVDLQIDPGEVVALVGPSGSGKSTVAALLLRMYDPGGGRVTFDGIDVRELDPSWLRRQAGVVAQEPILFSTSILENVRYGVEAASLEAVHRALRTANAADFVASMPDGLETKVGERGTQLSGGQKQRIAIARALLRNPRLLILDEATSALDSENERLVKDALDRLMRDRSTLIIAHRLSTVLHADRVLVLSDGRVVQSGSHASLVRQDGLYRKLVERQFIEA
jgi:ABC transporter fused permease/ATP-binding protein